MCGCTAASACRLPDGPCSWAEPDLCDAPSCLEAASRALWEEYWSMANGPVEGTGDLATFRRLYAGLILRACRLTQLLETREADLAGLI